MRLGGAGQEGDQLQCRPGHRGARVSDRHRPRRLRAVRGPDRRRRDRGEREELGQNITTAEQQTADYAKAKLKWVANHQPLPFLYESTGKITRFTDARDPKPRSREVFSFHRPETMREWTEVDASLRARLAAMPPLNPQALPAAEIGLRECQETAVSNLEISFKDQKQDAPGIGVLEQPVNLGDRGEGLAGPGGHPDESAGAIRAEREAAPVRPTGRKRASASPA